ncbi:hypothetical protein ACOBR2_06705 [Telmatobacter bradus]|uniref:hypothetical protein n=1 Tax=Telmatobacter bradus TaxID=474953 RepID=UPI003B43629C
MASVTSEPDSVLVKGPSPKESLFPWTSLDENGNHKPVIAAVEENHAPVISKPIGFLGIAFAVFVGNLLTAIVVSFVYAITHT